MSDFQRDDDRFYFIQLSLAACMAASVMVLYYYSATINDFILDFDGYGLLPFENSGLSVQVVLNNVIVGFKFLTGYALAFWSCTAVLGFIVSFLFFVFRVSKASGN